MKDGRVNTIAIAEKMKVNNNRECRTDKKKLLSQDDTKVSEVEFATS